MNNTKAYQQLRQLADLQRSAARMEAMRAVGASLDAETAGASGLQAQPQASARTPCVVEAAQRGLD